MDILPYSDQYKDQTIRLVLSILEDEFGLSGVNRPDIYSIPDTYQHGKSNFWIAIEHGNVIGTIALRDYGKNRGYMKRMYVDKRFRRKGVASALFEVLLAFAKVHEYTEIYLATIPEMVDANTFYLKKGFQKIESLPEDIPSLGDTSYYRLDV